MKISDIRASLQRLAERLDNQWHTPGLMPRWTLLPAVPSTTMTERGCLPSRRSATTHDCRIETLGGEWKRNADGRHWLCLGGIVASTQSK